MERDENHPRQQFARANWIDLCGPWQFAYDDQAVGLDEGWVEKAEVFDRTITVPFPPESRASGIGDTAPHSVVWYRRTFRWAGETPDERLMLHFGAVDYRAQVWVNGGLAAQHEGGQTPFRADVTRFLLPGDVDQVLVVRAEDTTSDLSQPRGKQFWEPEPRAIWYDRTTGIWQPVWLEPVKSIHMVDIRWTPDLDRGLLGLQVLLNEMPPRPMRLRVQLSLRGVRLADDSYTCETLEVRREIALEQARLTMSREDLLWSPRFPNLLDAVLTLYDDDGTVDEVMSYAGLRSAGYSNGRFLLNGSPYYLRMVLEQGLWPDTLLAAPSNDALRFEVEMTKALGFNGVRIHQKVEDPRYLYWCDKLGLLVWGEMANAYVFSRTAVERLTREWMDVVRRDFSHPCIVMWVPLNESWGVPSLERDPCAARLCARPLSSHARAGPHAAGDRQRRLGAHRQRPLGRARLCARRRDDPRALWQPRGGAKHPPPDPPHAPHRRLAGLRAQGRADHAHGMRRHQLRRGSEPAVPRLLDGERPCGAARTL